ncbi:MAG: hypothetical protein K2H46_02395 [Muribaculaceae bacterium]|nr:hypothetical protein [Muribaculaceae bacterium]
MTKDKIINKIRSFLPKYPNVRFFIDVLDDYGCYGVAYIVPEELENVDAFWDELMDLKNDIRELSPESQTLFTENDMLFSLSDKAYNILPETKLMKTTECFTSINEETHQFSLDAEHIIFADNCDFYLLAA